MRRWLAIARPSHRACNLRRMLPSVSRNVRRNEPSIARLSVHHCASLQVASVGERSGTRHESKGRCVQIAAVPRRHNIAWVKSNHCGCSYRRLQSPLFAPRTRRPSSSLPSAQEIAKGTARACVWIFNLGAFPRHSLRSAGRLCRNPQRISANSPLPFLAGLGPKTITTSGGASPHAVRPRTARTIQINKHAPMNPAIR